MIGNVDNSRGHLRLLICFTVFEMALVGESFLLGWEVAPVVLLLIGLLVCWFSHIAEKFTAEVRLWMYFMLCMLAFFFYGIHDTSFFDLAPVMAVIMLLMMSVGNIVIIRFCASVYYFTIVYDLLFVLNDSFELTSLNITRLLLHMLVIYLAAALITAIIREREKLSSRLDDKIRELDESSHKTENFLVNVSHELRTPINVIMGLADVMHAKEKDAEKIESIASIESAGRRLYDRVEDILDYTEISTGDISISNESYMISSLINDLVTAENIAERSKFTELIFDINPNIPMMLVGDAKKVKKVIRHLIDNAFKFTPEGAILVTLDYHHRDYGVNLCISVQDTGRGIEEEDVTKLSEGFYQQDGERNRSAGGMGLGLSIVVGMVAAMGGFIKIDSVYGSGTTVTVSIPQGVAEPGRSISLADTSQTCVAVYLKPEKYKFSEIRLFYNNTIANLAHGLGIPVYRANNESELSRIVARYNLSHLFIAKEEYLERPDYYEELSAMMQICAVVNDPTVISANSRVVPIIKPFYFLPIMDFLNSSLDTNNAFFDTRKFTCPGLRALVVDDEPMNLMVAKQVFSTYDMEVTTVDSGRQAIATCQEMDFDIIFLDHMMPEMDGVETLGELRKLERGTDRHTTTIAFTANALSGARDMFLGVGFDEFLPKPIERIELERLLKKLLPAEAIVYEGQKSVQAAEAEVAAPAADATPATAAELAAETAAPEPELTPEPEAPTAPEPEPAPDASSGDMKSTLAAGGIDIETGLNYCSGSEDFYVFLLESYLEEYPEKMGDIKRFYADQDWENYRIVVHSVKSTSKMIGAMDLSEQSLALEMASKDADADFIFAHHDALVEDFNKVITCVATAINATVELL